LDPRDEPKVLPLQSEVARVEDSRKEDRILAALEAASCACKGENNYVIENLMKYALKHLKFKH